MHLNAKSGRPIITKADENIEKNSKSGAYSSAFNESNNEMLNVSKNQIARFWPTIWAREMSAQKWHSTAPTQDNNTEVDICIVLLEGNVLIHVIACDE